MREVLAHLELAVRAADDKGATAPVALEVGEQFGFADAFLILTGSVERNVQAISDAIEEALNAAGVRTLRREGRESGRWVLLDFGDIVVHVFHQEERGFYQLEKLWSDCPVVDLAPMLEAAAPDSAFDDRS
ncbi:ribosome silencing factor [Leucobacter sp. gxy201]|uniref:ribosome silencing factor n=1 Tax=Leucobacter sp. gxy201 TaxID=2957200 RepID=UPI003DA14715